VRGSKNIGLMSIREILSSWMANRSGRPRITTTSCERLNLPYGPRYHTSESFTWPREGSLQNLNSEQEALFSLKDRNRKPKEEILDRCNPNNKRS